MSSSTHILRIDAGANHPGSVTRSLADEVTARLTNADTTLTVRDLTDGLPFINGGWVAASAGASDDPSALAQSNELVDELLAADVLILTAPIYNFGVPAALKAWIDQVARAGRTFHYTEDGPEGLISGTRAIIVTASGGTPVDSEIDFAVRYLRHILGFLGINQVEVVAAEQQMLRGDAAVVDARAAIDRLDAAIAA
jgi:FMN-dependent NADH-azoreductase